MTEDTRATAFGRQLIEVHDWLRTQLGTIRKSLEMRTPPELSDLRLHCLTFCAAITRHHTGEDAVAFPELTAQVPELAAVVAQLRQDHDLVTTLIADFQVTLEDPATTPEAAARHLDGLAAILESHFAFEERKIAVALDGLRNPGWGPNPDFLSATREP